MAVMDALLRIKAAVTGGEAIQQLGASLGKLNSTANQVGGGLSKLAGSAQGLVGGLGALVPLASGAGLMALAKSSIDAADNMNDLRQKTGASVESLSQFQQAAEKSGTTLDAVGGAMVKLNRNLAEGKAGKSLQEIGISATDASGKLKSTDQIMLELADKFQSMPDGAEKTALAMDLFGKSGAALIPMLNMGDEAIKKLGVTMTGEFASKADELNDKFVDLQTGVTRLAVGLGTALMPALQVVTDALIGALNIFTQLPGPLQAIVGGFTALVIGLAILAPAITAVVTIITALTALPVAATIAGWLSAAIPAVASITSALVGLLTFMTSTFLPGMIAVFTSPVGW
ncbi:phage tail tape measure protein, partial [bacterium]|nr:phage tail tape measure protein [bacterium]